MAERIQLTEDQSADVVGGAFNFYIDKQGRPACFVDGVGKFYSIGNGSSAYNALKAEHIDASVDEMIQLCKEVGIIRDI